jgi:hypothetical protein
MKTLFHRLLLTSCTAALLALPAQAVTLVAKTQAPPAPVIQNTPPQQQAAPVEDILDIRGPVHIPAPIPWAMWSAGTAAAIALGFGLWKLLHRARRKLPYEIALGKLEATRPLMQGDNAEPFSIAVSEIVRLFIEECLPVPAAHRTTHEFLRDLISLPDSPLAAHRDTLADFLEHCDLAKFARWSLTQPQMEAMLVSASTLVIAIGKPKVAKKPAAPSAPVPAATLVTTHS